MNEKTRTLQRIPNRCLSQSESSRWCSNTCTKYSALWAVDISWKSLVPHHLHDIIPPSYCITAQYSSLKYHDIPQTGLVHISVFIIVIICLLNFSWTIYLRSFLGLNLFVVNLSHLRKRHFSVMRSLEDLFFFCLEAYYFILYLLLHPTVLVHLQHLPFSLRQQQQQWLKDECAHLPNPCDWGSLLCTSTVLSVCKNTVPMRAVEKWDIQMKATPKTHHVFLDRQLARRCLSALFTT